MIVLAVAALSILSLSFPPLAGTALAAESVARDSDGDGLSDSSEEQGFRADGRFVNLPAMGANKFRKDIFLQIDWMDAANMRPKPGVLKKLHEAFARKGINLHLDNGPDSIKDFGMDPDDPRSKWGSLSRAAARPFKKNLEVVTRDNPVDFRPFHAGYRDKFFRPTGRSSAFRYVLFANAFDPGPSYSSGFSDGRDMVVSVHTFPVATTRGQRCTLGTRASQQAGSLMHELGHSLGLKHGGGDHSNYKPNYLSIMNYSFQITGLLKYNPDTTSKVTCGNLDYSGHRLSPLDETQLNEKVGLSSKSQGYATQHYCGPGRNTTRYPTAKRYTVPNANGPIDWDCDGKLDSEQTSYNVNRGAVSILNGYDDWSNLNYPVGRAAAGLGTPPGPHQELDPFTSDMLDDSVATPVTFASLSPPPNDAGWNRTDVTVTLNASDGGDMDADLLDDPADATESGIQSITYSAAGAEQRAVSSVMGDSVQFTISAEGETTITFSATSSSGTIEPLRSVIVRVDKTPPTLTCSATPSTLWPPNNKLKPVSIAVNLQDSLSGPAGFTLRSATSDEGNDPNDIQGFVLGTPDTTGQLRAQRLGSGDGRTYTLTYEGSDIAGNTARCSSTVTVAHDRRGG